MTQTTPDDASEDDLDSLVQFLRDEYHDSNGEVPTNEFEDRFGRGLRVFNLMIQDREPYSLSLGRHQQTDWG